MNSPKNGKARKHQGRITRFIGTDFTTRPHQYSESGSSLRLTTLLAIVTPNSNCYEIRHLETQKCSFNSKCRGAVSSDKNTLKEVKLNQVVFQEIGSVA
jgi:hypothetical protein